MIHLCGTPSQLRKTCWIKLATPFKLPPLTCYLDGCFFWAVTGHCEKCAEITQLRNCSQTTFDSFGNKQKSILAIWWPAHAQVLVWDRLKPNLILSLWLICVWMWNKDVKSDQVLWFDFNEVWTCENKRKEWSYERSRQRSEEPFGPRRVCLPGGCESAVTQQRQQRCAKESWQQQGAFWKQTKDPALDFHSTSWVNSAVGQILKSAKL